MAGGWIRAALALLAVMGALAASAAPASAQTYVQVINRYRAAEGLHSETGPVTSGPFNPRWWSADWTFEPTGEPNVYRIVNRHRGSVLAATPALALASPALVSPGALWQVEDAGNGYYRIGNRMVQGAYLHTENGRLELGPIQPGWWSAHWALKGFGAQTGRSTEQNVYYAPDPDDRGQHGWIAGRDPVITVYNPLDGAPFLRYRYMGEPGSSDGCSGPGAASDKTRFRSACFAHDLAYDTPFAAFGFPAYESDGMSLGRDIADFLFLKDMMTICDGDWTCEASAGSFWTAVQGFAKDGYRGNAPATLMEKGGVIAVKNNGGYSAILRVEWTAPDGSSKSTQVETTAGTQAMVVPLSIGARNIQMSVEARGGKAIAKKSFAGPGMYAFTVTGTTLVNGIEDGLKGGTAAGAFTTVKEAFTGGTAPSGLRSIRLRSEAGYVSSMAVQYFEGTTMRFVATDKITAGLSRVIVLPPGTNFDLPITVTIQGVGTVKADPLFSTTIMGAFQGEKCVKATGTIFNAGGATC
ncbi:RICIN domain-containing protein [Sphingomonas sp. CJ99]